VCKKVFQVVVRRRCGASRRGEEEPLQGIPAREDFKFSAVLSIAARKKLANLKQGDWTRLTAGPFVDLPVYLKEIEYKDGNASVATTFSRPSAGSRCSCAYRTRSSDYNTMPSFFLRIARYPHVPQPAKMRRRARQEGLVRHVPQPIFLTRLLH